VPHIYTNKDQIIIYVATPPNEPHQCILTHFNNCNLARLRQCAPWWWCFTPKHVGAF